MKVLKREKREQVRMALSEQINATGRSKFSCESDQFRRSSVSKAPTVIRKRRTLIFHWLWLKKRVLLGVVLFFGYVGSFFALRQKTFLTDWIPNHNGTEFPFDFCTNRAYRFSSNRLVNRGLYFLYWPIHAVAMQGDSESVIFAECKTAADCNHDIYVEDVRFLNL